jgi:putative NIF3 family GTP cyclohydrolase 1 type 2
MKAIEVYKHFESKGTWVDWNNTCDQILWGDGETAVNGIAVCWTTNMNHLKEAKNNNCNLFICHEPLYHYPDSSPDSSPGEYEKKEFLKNSGLVIYRCHDFWDVMPELGIVDSWSKFLGFDGEPSAKARFYNAHDLPSGMKLKDLIGQIANKVKVFGQDVVNYIGDPDTIVTRIAVGTGAITGFRQMFSLKADVLLLTDDGTRLWESAVWSVDAGVPIIIVNHATAEEPGMINMAKYLQEQFLVPVHHIPQGCLYRSLT